MMTAIRMGESLESYARGDYLFVVISIANGTADVAGAYHDMTDAWQLAKSLAHGLAVDEPAMTCRGAGRLVTVRGTVISGSRSHAVMRLLSALRITTVPADTGSPWFRSVAYRGRVTGLTLRVLDGGGMEFVDADGGVIWSCADDSHVDVVALASELDGLLDADR
jgi:hypothetical protein